MIIPNFVLFIIPFSYHMKRVRLYFFIISLFIIYSDIFGQTERWSSDNPPNDKEMNDYIERNIASLDPIEGIWHLEIIGRGWNNYRSFPDEHLFNDNVAIIKKGSRFNVYPLDSYITKIGANQYSYHHFVNHFGKQEMVVNSFYLSDLTAFSVSVDMAVKADRVGSKVRHIINSNKIRPTEEEYASLMEEKSKPTNWSGSGFALNNDYVVTNYHVIAEATSIKVLGVNGNTSQAFNAEVIAKDKTNDLAIIKIDDSHFSGFGPIPYAINGQMMDVGEDIWVLGYPLTQVLGNEIKLTNGVISSRSGYQGDVSTYQISAPVQPGNSGGPLFDPNGNIVGIVNAGVPGAENVGYAIKASYLKNLADSYSLTSSLPSNNIISSLPFKEQVKVVRNYVLMLLCSSNPHNARSMSGQSISSFTTSNSSIKSTSSVRDNNGIIQSLNQSKITLKVGQKFQILASPQSVPIIKCESDNSDVAYVSPEGLVIGLAKGQTNIWVHGPANQKLCVVTVE